MKKIHVSLVFVLVGLTSLTGLWYLQQSPSTESRLSPRAETIVKKNAKPYDAPAEANAYFFEKRMPKDTKASYYDLFAPAYRATQSMPVYSSRAERLMEPGEAIRGGAESWEELGPGNVGGRTRAMVINPNNPSHMVAGGVAGGTWVTMDGGLSWTPTGDMMANLAVCSMAMDPSDANVILAGTGEGFFNIDGVRGAGIFKSMDGGLTWAQLTATNTTDFHRVNDIVFSHTQPNTAYAATRSGIFRTTDGGDSWTNILDMDPLPSGGALDLAIRTDLQTDVVFASVGTFEQAFILRNADAANTAVFETVYTEENMARTSIAIAPSDQDTIYLCASDVRNNALLAVIRTDNGGNDWDDAYRVSEPIGGADLMLSNPWVFLCRQSLSSQGWYDNIIKVDPADSDVVWVGGIDLFRSDDGGTTWGQASHWLALGFSYVHADNHNIIFHPAYDGITNRTMYATGDGGVFRTDDARSPVGEISSGPVCSTLEGFEVRWTSLNNGYGVTQFYHGLPFPDGSTYFGGTQDNGTNLGSDASGPNNWVEISGGDGGYVAVDPNNPDILYAEFTGISIQKSTDGGQNFSSATNGISDNGLFINPFLMDPNDSNRLWTGGNSIWRTSDGAANWTRASSPVNVNMTAFAVAPGNSDLVLVGTNAGVVFRSDVASQEDDSDLWPFFSVDQGIISSVAFDPQDADIAYCTISTFGVGHVFRSTDSGQNWTNIDNGIPDIPVHTIAVHPTDSTRLYVGTDLGVFVSTDTGATWNQENTGYANVVTEWIEFQADDCGLFLFAFTHGRGAYRLPLTSITLSASSAQYDAGGGDSTFDVTAMGNCVWSATTQDSWIRITAGETGTGSGQVAYSVSPNPTSTARTGTISVGSRVFTINQDGDSTCSYALSAGSATFTATGGDGTFDVTPSPANCAFEVTTQYPWITINTTRGGSTTISYSVAQHFSTIPRTGTIEVEGEVLTINQQGVVPCAYTLSSQSGSFGEAGGDGTFDVTTNLTTCSWEATTQNSWITITSGQSGTGAGSVAFTVGVNTSSASRVGLIQVADQTFSVIQAASVCEYTLSSQSETFTSDGGEGTFDITTNPETCIWAPTTQFPWITITSGQSGTGNGTITFAVAANTATATRTGAIEVGGQTFTVVQEAAPPCDLTLSANSVVLDSPSGSSSFNVTTNVSTCQWTATTQDGWIVITSGQIGVGNGTVAFNVTTNDTGANRSGTITITNSDETVTFTVFQGDCLPTEQLLEAVSAWPTNDVLTLVPLSGCAPAQQPDTKAANKTAPALAPKLETEARDR